MSTSKESNEKIVMDWLKQNNKYLTWTKIDGNEPPVNLNRQYLNQNEGYEIRDLIIRFFNKTDIEYTKNHVSDTYSKIKDYKSDEKITVYDVLSYLHEIYEVGLLC